MKSANPQNPRPVVSALFVAWSIMYLLYALLGVWTSTGPDAIDSRTHPSAMGDYVWSGVWLALSVLQLVLAIMLHRSYRQKLFWVVASFAMLSAGLFFGPVIALAFR